MTDGVQNAAIIQEMNHGKDTKYDLLTIFRMIPTTVHLDAKMDISTKPSKCITAYPINYASMSTCMSVQQLHHKTREIYEYYRHYERWVRCIKNEN